MIKNYLRLLLVEKHAYKTNTAIEYVQSKPQIAIPSNVSSDRNPSLPAAEYNEQQITIWKSRK